MDLTKLDYELLLAMRVELNNEIQAREKAVYERLDKGEEVAGWGYAKGKLVRKVTSEGALADKLRTLGFKNSQFYDAKLKGIPAIEKMLKEKGLDYSNIKPFISEKHADPKPVYVGVEKDV